MISSAATLMTPAATCYSIANRVTLMTRRILPVILILLAAQRAAAEATTLPASPSFSRHVVPIFSKLGCNAGACHGAVQGQNGFRLSLFGMEPALDHARLLREFSGRRISTINPGDSLLLLKATGQSPHRGGIRTTPKSTDYRIVHRWMEQGANLDAVPNSRIKQLVVSPGEKLAPVGASYQLKVQATFVDESTEDVTHLCTFESGNADVAQVNHDGHVRLVGVGEAPIVVRYRAQPALAMVLVPGQPLPSFPSIVEQNFVDRHVFAKLRKLNIEPSEACDDTTFLRRVRLDVIGALPSPEEVRAFLADTDPAKRVKKIDQLLEHSGYSALWATKFCDVLKSRISYEDFTHQPASASIRHFHDWIRARLKENTPYDQMVTRMLLATSLDGRTRDAWIEEVIDSLSEKPDGSGKGAYAERQTLDLFWHRFDSAGVKGAVQFAHSFLGLRLQCAQCHRHPSDVWSQDDVLSLSNFFQRTRTNTGVMSVKEAGQIKKSIGVGLTTEEKTRLTERASKLSAEGKKLQEQAKTKKGVKAEADKLQADGKALIDQAGAITRAIKVLEVSYVGPVEGNPFGWASVTSPLGTQSSETFRLLGERDNLSIAKDQDPREVLAKWTAGADNPFFARAIVNRVWAHYFGRGIVDPPDDLSPLNPATHPELLKELADTFVKQKYDLKWLHRTILSSATYQRSSRTKPTNQFDTRNFASFYPRRMSAEVLVDALGQATGLPEAFKSTSVPSNAKAVELPGTIADRMVGNPSVELAFTIFGRPTRNAEALCDCDRETRPALVQSLYLANHPDLLKKIGSPKGRLADLLKSVTDDTKRIEELYLWTLSRLPSKTELATCREHVRKGSSTASGYEGLFWALLNTREFILNH